MNLKTLIDIVKAQIGELSTVPKPDVRLEQAEYNKEKQTWDIVVSYLVENTNPRSAIAALVSDFQFYRIYKRVVIDSNNEIIGIYIYNKDDPH